MGHIETKAPNISASPQPPHACVQLKADTVRNIASRGKASIEDSSEKKITKTKLPDKPRTSRLRSTGCRTCRLRKIKCDELRPVCRNCTKSQRGCLGYDHVAKTEAATVPVYPHNAPIVPAKKKPRASIETDTPRTDIHDPSSWNGSPVTGSSMSPCFDDFPELGIDGDAKYYLSHQVYDTESYDPENDLVSHSISDEPGQLSIAAPLPTSAYRLETFFFQRFISSVWLHSQTDAWRYYLPGVLNQSACLYYSVMSLSALYMFKTGVDSRAKNLALSSYQITLSLLQKALYDPALALEDTTLMATVIIGLYELVDKPGHLSWCSHSRGTAELMRIRGPSAASSGIFRTIFLTFRGFEVIRAILQLEDTFVAEKSWTVASSSTQTLLSSAGELAASPLSVSRKPAALDAESPDYAAVLFMLGGQVANLQAACAKFARSGRMDPAASQHFLDQAKSLEVSLHNWRDNLPPMYNARERPSTLASSPYHTIQEFDNMQVGYQLCFYSAFLLLIHRTIAKFVLKDVRQIPVSDQEYARFILKTADFLTQGLTTASLHVTWPIYMASISLRDEIERQWTVVLLQSIVQDKGWGVANAALYAASVIARKNQVRAYNEI